nr:chemotaxis protein CheW [Pigmentibacter ruber]
MTYGFFNDKKIEQNQYLRFRLNTQLFCIGIDSIREINQLVEVVTIPNTPEFIIGVINLRGKIIPVVDLRVKFGLGILQITKETCVIIIECSLGFIGIAIDDVHDVITLENNQIKMPEVIENNKLNYIKGLGKVDSKIFIIIDILNSFSKEDFFNVQNISFSHT